MQARTSTLGVLAVMTLSATGSKAPEFTLGSTGAVILDVRGNEARYGFIPTEPGGRPMLAISLGATTAAGSLALLVPGDHTPEPGRYFVTGRWDGPEAESGLHANFVAGTVARPLGTFHGEYGVVTITAARDGVVSGEYEIMARGFLSRNPDDEDHWVTLRGRFRAEGDGSVLAGN